MTTESLLATLPAEILPDAETGLTAEQVDRSAQLYGRNVYTPLPQKTAFDIVKVAFEDTMLRVLIAAAVVSILLGIRSGEYVDGIAISVAVLVVVAVGTINELRAQRDYSELEDASSQETLRVVRDGHIVELDASELVVADVVDINVGDVLPADLEYLSGPRLIVSEAQITGEPETRKTNGDTLYASSRILDGSGRGLVGSVGDETVFGKIRKELESTDRETPLQQRLEEFAARIGLFGTIVAALTFFALLISDIARDHVEVAWNLDFFEAVLEAITVAVTIVVVTVPEGLPLAVTLSLAYTTRRMAKEQALVRELAACETMGAATIVCTDKTGTLTYGRMDVAWIRHGGQDIAPADFATISGGDRTQLIRAFSVNSTADLVEDATGRHVAGNSTEGALLEMLAAHDIDYLEIRKRFAIADRVEFNSERKFMLTAISVEGSTEVHIKGAPEIVLERCATIERAPITDPARQAILDAVQDAARRGYRTLGFAAGPADDALDFIALAVLADGLRPEVPDSVRRCRNAGVDVMMITGDIQETAFEISRQAGIADDLAQVITGSEFRELTDDQVKARIPNVRVMARALPDDKKRMAELLQQTGAVVAMTGDGVNDAPALVAADVGFSMGSGSKVAREASDIVVVDDDFTTIVRAIRWGRAVFENIRKFLQFQLTVNVVALGVTFTAALAGFGTPLTPVQLLWVNLIMDSLAAVALTLQEPSDTLYDQKPHGRTEPLISRFMWTNIIVMGLYMFAIMWLVLGTDVFTDVAREDLSRTTLVFNVFVFLQVFNAFNSRVVRANRSPFTEFAKSTSFVFIMALIVVVQAFIVIVGPSSVFSTEPLSAAHWLLSVGLGFTVIPVGLLVRRLASLR